MYYRINMQTIFLKIFACKLVENHLSAILTNFFSVSAPFSVLLAVHFSISGARNYCSTLMQRTLALPVCKYEYDFTIYNKLLLLYCQPYR